MQQLEMNDGTILENSYSAETMDSLFLYVRNGMTMMQVFVLMSDPRATEHIIYRSGDATVEHGGFTVLSGINTEFGGMISVVLRRTPVN